MATTIEINPTDAFWYQKSDKFWGGARDSVSSDSFYSTNPGSVGIFLDAPNYNFFRTYLSFDLSIIPVEASIETITINLKRVDSIRGTYSPIIAYGGDKLDGGLTEYSLYLNNINVDGKALATIDIGDDGLYYSSTDFDKSYLILPGDTLVVGIIDDLDFNNSVDSYSDNYLIDITTNRSKPFLRVTYTGGIVNYPNNVIGVASANISSVRGVLSENISKINVV